MSVVSVVETVMWILGNHVKGIDNMHGRAALAGIKFVFLWEGAWCFSWSSAGHYICSKWRPPWQPADMHSKIPALLVWCLNTTFIVAALAALLFPLITFTMVELRAQDLISSVASVCIRLRRLDEHKVVKFEFSTAMVVLRPLLHSLPKLVQLIFICLASAQRRVLGPKDSFWTTIVRKVIYKANNLTSTSSAQKPAFNYAREQNVLILISLIILISGTAFMPVPILEYRNATIENIAGVTDQLMTDLPSSPLKISTFVASTISNILMLLVLLQTIRLSTPKYSSGSQTTVRSDDFRMTLSSKHISVHPPHENRMHPGFTPSFEDPEKGLRTDYEKWTQDTLSKGNCADEASEITLLEGSTAV
ncbi:hypothetical protein DFH28DRAFT_922397 [Melampsora americana]|nr:hypothetical protein DFH28DRAFT_922397 [Melampsora americana]